MNIYKMYLWIGRVLFGKPFVEGASVVYTSWEPREGLMYWYPHIGYQKPEASSSAFSPYEAEEYMKGSKPHIFASKKDAIEASRRCIETLKAYHDELGY